MKKISLAGIGVAAATATFTVLAISGTASPGDLKAKAKPDCPKNAICLWDEEDYQGQRVVVKTKNPSDRVYNEMNDLASSAFMSRKEGVAVLYTDTSSDGEAVCLYEQNHRRIKGFPDPFDDSISSTDVKGRVPSTCTL
jgi:Peptidase inhibitor family I36